MPDIISFLQDLQEDVNDSKLQWRAYEGMDMKNGFGLTQKRLNGE